jgi:hypothetical protein
VQESTAFEDFGTRVAAHTDIAPASQTLGTMIGSFGDVAKEGILTALDNNEGFDANTDPLDLLLTNIPEVGKTALKLQGVDLDDPEVIAQVRTDLQPDLDILATDIQEPLAIGFAAAARAATSTAAIFVVGGAVASILLPNGRRRPLPEGEQVAVVAH